MTIEIIKQKLATYDINVKEDEALALKEILQEILLFSLSQSEFFQKAIFHGGTALRIHYRLPRFSEDLDFMLIEPNLDFKWESYVEDMIKTCQIFGLQPEVQDRLQLEKTIQKLFIKDRSIGKLLSLNFPHDPRKKLSIKLEIDTNPPKGSINEIKFLDFPMATSVLVQNLPSGFALKTHAILCRSYTKGRDWYDFIWYIQRKTPINFDLLHNALQQQGPWAGQMEGALSREHLIERLAERITREDWKKVIRDIAPFISPLEQQSLAVWNQDYFLFLLDKLKEYI